MKKNLLISFSGGRTSGYMLYWLWNEWPDRHRWNMKVVFANTGKEAEGTLFFVDECSQEWNIPIIWVEGYPNEIGAGASVYCRIVTYETASRNGEPFEALIKKLGIPSSNAPFCSDHMKKKAIEAYLKRIKFKNFYKAIGIRVDEPLRINSEYISKKIIYPLVHQNPKTKLDIFNWWKKQSFDLNIHEDEGNCNNCWKKDFPRLIRNMVRNPKSFEWWRDMEIKYGGFNPRNIELLPPFNFFRGNKSTVDILDMANNPKKKDIQMDLFANSCVESCNPEW